MKTFFFLVTLSVLFSCGSKDQQFCDCLKTGDELNEFSSKLFNKEVTPEIQKKMKELKSKKKLACKNYQTMSGEKMMELKSECK